MYELFILSLLVRFPAHGYLIAHIVNDMIGPYAKISNGRLYPLLAKLEESGLIEASEEADPEQRGERNSRGYQITEAGRTRFHALMLDTTSNPGEYQRIFMHKVPVLYLLQPFERLYLIDHYINYCQAHVLHLTAEAEDLATKQYRGYERESTSLTATLGVMKHVEDQWQREVAWALRLRQEELVRQQGNDAQEEQTGVSVPHKKRNHNQNQNHNRNRN
ncbi:MAG: PadR family transcriptional regulator [Ktedonobacteraceae bacterium]